MRDSRAARSSAFSRGPPRSGQAARLRAAQAGPLFRWTCHVGALAFAPLALALAQAVISGGFVVLAVLGERLFGFHLGCRQWMGIGLVALGLGFLGATTTAAARQTCYSVIAIAIFQGVLLTVGLLLVLVSRIAARRHQYPIEPPPALGPPDPEHPVTGGPPQAPVTAHETLRHRSKSAGLLLGTAAGIAPLRVPPRTSPPSSPGSRCSASPSATASLRPRCGCSHSASSSPGPSGCRAPCAPPRLVRAKNARTRGGSPRGSPHRHRASPAPAQRNMFAT